MIDDSGRGISLFNELYAAGLTEESNGFCCRSKKGMG
jgi:hypothetical protein